MPPAAPEGMVLAPASIGALSVFQMHRLWLLERHGRSSRPASPDFAGVVAILGDGCVYLLVVRADDRSRAGEAAILDGSVRVHLERDGVRCATMDDALVYADDLRRRWLARGWTASDDDRRAEQRTRLRGSVS